MEARKPYFRKKTAWVKFRENTSAGKCLHASLAKAFKQRITAPKFYQEPSLSGLAATGLVLLGVARAAQPSTQAVPVLNG